MKTLSLKLLIPVFLLNLTSCGLLRSINEPSEDIVPPQEEVSDNLLQDIIRVSTTEHGEELDLGAIGSRPSISANGEFVSFQSDGSVIDGISGLQQFKRNIKNSEMDLLSISSTGEASNATSSGGSIPLSYDGRYAVFHSSANNLLDDILEVETHLVYRRDTLIGTTELVSLGYNELPAQYSYHPSISDDGRFVAFSSFANNVVEGVEGVYHIYVRDMQEGTNELISASSGGLPGNNGSWSPALSPEGRYVAFSSDSTNLVDGDTNEKRDIFVHDRQTKETVRVSIASDGSQANDTSNTSSGPPAISADGRYIAFESFASNLVEGDDNGLWDIFVHDRQTGETTRVNLSDDGSQTLCNIEVCQAWGPGGHSRSPSISADGRFVAFQSDADNLVSNDTNELTDIFVHDRQTGETKRINLSNYGDQAEGVLGCAMGIGEECFEWTLKGNSSTASISSDGKFVTFQSDASNLVPNDTNNLTDIFVKDLSVRIFKLNF